MTAGTPENDPTAVLPVASKVRRQRLRRFMVGIAGILAVFALWQVLTSLVAYTDDGYVASNFIAVAPQVTGVMARVNVENNQDVHKGDLLAVIDDAPFRLAVAGRKAALQVATAELDAARDAVEVAQTGVANGTGDTVGLDRANRALEMRTVAVAAARAALDLADWQLTQTEIRAPADGAINNLGVNPGDTATAGTPLIGIVDAAGWRIVANYKESYIAGLHEGETAWVWLDTHPWRFYRARIEGVARGISRNEAEGRLLPYVAPTTDWIRLKRRFPVTLTLVDPPAGLMLYMGADARALIFQ
jgi:multidrug efflux system membrane fusion protein